MKRGVYENDSSNFVFTEITIETYVLQKNTIKPSFSIFMKDTNKACCHKINH